MTETPLTSDDTVFRESTFKIKNMIGSGSFGKVYEATLLKSGTSFAIKKVLQDGRFKNRELDILKVVSGLPNVIEMKGFFYSEDPLTDSSYLNIVMPILDTTLSTLLKQRAKFKMPLSPEEQKTISFQILLGLANIHGVGIMHRDLKPQNLLVSYDTLEVKLCDFGSAKKSNANEKNVAYICSRFYRAPELIFGAEIYSDKIDCWSAGCIIAELLMGSPLFLSDSTTGHIIEIMKVLGTPSKKEILNMNDEYDSFSFPLIKVFPLAKLLKQAGADDDLVDLLKRILVYDPNERLSAREALEHNYFKDVRTKFL